MSTTNKPIRDELNTKGKNISPFVSNGDTFRSADKTSLDLTNPSPFGGPINASRYQHQHLYTPENTYLKKFQEAASPNSAFGTEGDEVLPGSIFEKTSLDVENPLPIGGPNRTNAYNIPNGSYTNNRSGNKYGESTGGPLMNKEGKIVNNQVQKYTSKNSYLDEFSGILPEVQPEIPNRPQTIPNIPNPSNIISDIKKDIPL